MLLSSELRSPSLVAHLVPSFNWHRCLHILSSQIFTLSVNSSFCWSDNFKREKLMKDKICEKVFLVNGLNFKFSSLSNGFLFGSSLLRVAAANRSEKFIFQLFLCFIFYLKKNCKDKLSVSIQIVALKTSSVSTSLIWEFHENLLTCFILFIY